MGTRRLLAIFDALASLATAFKDIFPGSITSTLSEEELAAHVAALGTRAALKPKVIPVDETRLAALLYFAQPTPQAGLLIDLRRPVRTSDSHFARSFCRVFNDDLSRVSAALPLNEHWASLEQTRLRRAVARFLNYRPHQMSSWIRAVEDSMALTYEGRAVRHCLIVARKAPKLVQKLQNKFIPLPGGISIENALLREKWIRTVVDGRRVALLGSMHSGSIIGFISLAEMDRQEVAALRYAPHETLLPVQAVLSHSPHDVALVASPQGDLFILSGKGSVFQKTHGHWRVLDYAALHERISMRFREDVVTGVLRAAIDLAFERTGALFCLVDSREELTDFITDHGHPLAANSHLRRSLRGQNIAIWAQRQVITAAATTDGAVVLDADGSILDIACMISSPKEIARLGVREPSMPGARALAAWRASFRGVAINVSEDGPITVYERGAVIGRIG